MAGQSRPWKEQGLESGIFFIPATQPPPLFHLSPPQVEYFGLKLAGMWFSGGPAAAARCAVLCEQACKGFWSTPL